MSTSWGTGTVTLTFAPRISLDQLIRQGNAIASIVGFASASATHEVTPMRATRVRITPLPEEHCQCGCL